jgi:hypothetical protein
MVVIDNQKEGLPMKEEEEEDIRWRWPSEMACRSWLEVEEMMAWRR